MRTKFIVLLLFAAVISATSFDQKDDFSEFDSPEDFDSQPPTKPVQAEQPKAEAVKNLPKEEVRIFCQ